MAGTQLNKDTKQQGSSQLSQFLIREIQVVVKSSLQQLSSCLRKHTKLQTNCNDLMTPKVRLMVSNNNTPSWVSTSVNTYFKNKLVFEHEARGKI